MDGRTDSRDGRGSKDGIGGRQHSEDLWEEGTGPGVPPQLMAGVTATRDPSHCCLWSKAGHSPRPSGWSWVVTAWSLQGQNGEPTGLGVHMGTRGAYRAGGDPWSWGVLMGL